MTDETEHRSYNVPEAGEENWHEPVNENWEAIDADMQEALDGSTSDGTGGGVSAYDVRVYQYETEDYEAIDGDGTIIDSGSDGESVLDSALNVVPDGGEIYIQGTYRISGSFDIGTSMTIHGPNAQFDIETGNTRYIFNADNETYHTITSFESSVSKGNYEVKVNDASDVEPGDIILIEAEDQGTPMGRDQPPGESHTVVSVSGSTITLEDSIVWRDGYSSGGDTDVRFINPIEVNMHGFSIEAPSEDEQYRGVRLGGCADSTIADLHIEKTGRQAILLEQCAHSAVRDCHITRCQDLSENDGYGIGVWAGSHDIIFERNSVKRCRHALTVTPGGAREVAIRNVVIRDCFASGNGSAGINCHGGSAHNVRIEGCTVHQQDGSPCIRSGAMETNIVDCRLINGSSGIENRNNPIGASITVVDTDIDSQTDGIVIARHSEIQYEHVYINGVRFHNEHRFGIEIDTNGEYIEQMTISDCQFDNCTEEVLRIRNQVNQFIITDNIFGETDDRHIYARDDTETDIRNLILKGNTFVDPGNDSIRFYHVTNGVISDNLFDISTGETAVRIQGDSDTNIAKNNTFYSNDTIFGDDEGLITRDNDIHDGTEWV